MRQLIPPMAMLVCCIAGCADSQSIIISEATAASLPDATMWRRTMIVAPSRPIVFEFEKTTKGNGSLVFPGGFVRTHDEHNDGVVFSPSTLRSRLVDLDGDGFADIDVDGIAVTFDEETEKEVGRTHVRAAFLFLPARGSFVQSVSNPMIYTSAEPMRGAGE